MHIKTETQSGKYISVTKASEIVGRTTNEIEQLCRAGKVQSKVIAGEWYLTEGSLSGYFNMTLSSVIPLAHLVEKEKDNKTQDSLFSGTPFSPVLGKTVNILAAVTLIFGGYYVASTSEGRLAGTQVIGYVQKTLDRSADIMAYVGYGVFDTIQNNHLANTLLALENLLYPKEQIVQSSGLVIVPATGEDAVDRAVREQIQDSFSDEVEVIPDKNGRSGIIKPVFKKSVGRSYMYVMVPVE
jgi:hypothetical protein